MRTKVDSALRLHPVEEWSKQLLRRQFRMICRMSRRNDEWAMRVSRWSPTLTNVGARRARGRPPARWDDRLNIFARAQLNTESWQEACTDLNFPSHEDAYVLFHSDGS